MKTINNRRYYECNVVMLAADKAENCIISTYKTLSFQTQYLTQSYLNHTNKEPYHLYILSDNEINEGDWIGYPNLKNWTPVQYLGGDLTGSEEKIIATTDRSLKKSIKGITTPEGVYVSTHDRILPQPSQSFIDYFIKRYNNRNAIDKVLVEWCERQYPDDGEIRHLLEIWDLKLNEDNTINTYIIKDVFTRQELEHFFKWMKDHRVYLDTDGCIEYKMSFEKELGLSEIFDKYLNLQSDL
jgi:hypothetical protein